MNNQNTEPRKSSDVLLSIESKVNAIHQSLTLFNTTNKLILERLNKVYNYIDKLEKELELERMDIATQQNKEIVQAQNGISMELEKNPIGTRRVSRVESKDPEDSKQAEKNPDKKIPVIQRLTNHEGKDLIMADISIMTEDKQLITKCKTNANGKWQALLSPGKYIAHVVKTDTATKTKREVMMNFEVPYSNTTVNLPLAAIKKST